MCEGVMMRSVRALAPSPLLLSNPEGGEASGDPLQVGNASPQSRRPRPQAAAPKGSRGSPKGMPSRNLSTQRRGLRGSAPAPRSGLQPLNWQRRSRFLSVLKTAI